MHDTCVAAAVITQLACTEPSITGRQVLQLDTHMHPCVKAQLHCLHSPQESGVVLVLSAGCGAFSAVGPCFSHSSSCHKKFHPITQAGHVAADQAASTTCVPFPWFALFGLCRRLFC